MDINPTDSFSILTLLLSRNGDVETNSGLYETIEDVHKICINNAKNVQFVCLNFQSGIGKRMQVKTICSGNR